MGLDDIKVGGGLVLFWTVRVSRACDKSYSFKLTSKILGSECEV